MKPVNYNTCFVYWIKVSDTSWSPANSSDAQLQFFRTCPNLGYISVITIDEGWTRITNDGLRFENIPSSYVGNYRYSLIYLSLNKAGLAENFYCHSNRVEVFDKQWKSSSCMAYRLFLAWTHRAHHTMHIEYSTSPLARASKKNVFHESLLSFWNF